MKARSLLAIATAVAMLPVGAAAVSAGPATSEDATNDVAIQRVASLSPSFSMAEGQPIEDFSFGSVDLESGNLRAVHLLYTIEREGTTIYNVMLVTGDVEVPEVGQQPTNGTVTVTIDANPLDPTRDPVEDVATDAFVIRLDEDTVIVTLADFHTMAVFRA